MKNHSLSLLAVGALAGGLAVFAALPKTYQFTGVVKAMGNDVISVDNGKETNEYGLSADTQGKDGLKVGDKVTITYRMMAAKIENKSAKPEAKKDEKKTEGKSAPKKKS